MGGTGGVKKWAGGGGGGDLPNRCSAFAGEKNIVVVFLCAKSCWQQPCHLNQVRVDPLGKRGQQIGERERSEFALPTCRWHGCVLLGLVRCTLELGGERIPGK